MSGSILDFIQFFAVSKAELAVEFPELKHFLAADGMPGVSWPKRSSEVEINLNESVVMEIGLANRLADVKVAAVDETWFGLKVGYRWKDRWQVRPTPNPQTSLVVDDDGSRDKIDKITIRLGVSMFVLPGRDYHLSAHQWQRAGAPYETWDYCGPVCERVILWVGNDSYSGQFVCWVLGCPSSPTAE